MKVRFHNEQMPPWTVHVSRVIYMSVTYTYKDGVLQDAVVEQEWSGGGDDGFTRTLNWTCDEDVQLLRSEGWHALKKPDDLVEMAVSFDDLFFVLHARNDLGKSIMVRIDPSLYEYGLVAHDVDEQGFFG
jgi:hypothetical protein